MLPFGFLEFYVGEWQYRIEIDEDPYDRTRKLWHCLVAPDGVHYYDEIDNIMGPYKKAKRETVKDIIAYIEFQRGRAKFSSSLAPSLEA